MEELSLVTRESFDAVMKHYADTVYRLAYSKCGNRHDADDIFQNVFLKYIRADKTFNDEEHRKAWLIRITINCAKSFVTSAWNRHRDFSEQGADAVSDSDDITDTETRSDVIDALMTLPDKYRTVIYLFYYESMTITEISKCMGISESNVKVRLSRGRDMLKEKLKGVYDDV